MKQQTKLTQKSEQVAEQQSQQQAANEFESSDELLRFDAAQTTVPPEIAQRLQKSTAHINPPTARPWWKNIFGAKS
ncbi:MAG TPA: hypothetical protein VNN22_24980 [Verrucomicrobiae bacterium]|nr:hypothetical protein [Verrucomicrobiae bacterium]